VADGAVGVGQSIRMKVRLLERGAEEEKDGAQDNKYKACARLRCRMLTHSSHDYRYYTSIRFQAKHSRIGVIRQLLAEKNESERKTAGDAPERRSRLDLANLAAPQRTGIYRQEGGQKCRNTDVRYRVAVVRHSDLPERSFTPLRFLRWSLCGPRFVAPEQQKSHRMSQCAFQRTGRMILSALSFTREERCIRSVLERA
jgi:hypothetical protein